MTVKEEFKGEWITDNYQPRVSDNQMFLPKIRIKVSKQVNSETLYF